MDFLADHLCPRKPGPAGASRAEPGKVCDACSEDGLPDNTNATGHPQAVFSISVWGTDAHRSSRQGRSGGRWFLSQKREELRRRPAVHVGKREMAVLECSIHQPTEPPALRGNSRGSGGEWVLGESLPVGDPDANPLLEKRETASGPFQTSRPAGEAP